MNEIDDFFRKQLTETWQNRLVEVSAPENPYANVKSRADFTRIREEEESKFAELCAESPAKALRKLQEEKWFWRRSASPEAAPIEPSCETTQEDLRQASIAFNEAGEEIDMMQRYTLSHPDWTYSINGEALGIELYDCDNPECSETNILDFEKLRIVKAVKRNREILAEYEAKRQLGWKPSFPDVPEDDFPD